MVHYHPIIVRPGPQGQFTAQALGIPEVQATAATAEEAVENARQQLASWPGSVHWVPLDGAPPAKRSLQDLVGHAKDDPDFDQYLEEIRRYREEVDARECSSSSSTPTT